MRNVVCDHCGKAEAVPGTSRLNDWSAVKHLRREPDERAPHRQVTNTYHYELCPDCSSAIATFLAGGE